jgi:hypothetical protein
MISVASIGALFWPSTIVGRAQAVRRAQGEESIERLRRQLAARNRRLELVHRDLTAKLALLKRDASGGASRIRMV